MKKPEKAGKNGEERKKGSRERHEPEGKYSAERVER